MNETADIDYSALSLEYIQTLATMPDLNKTDETRQLVDGWSAWYESTKGD